jgi:PAS domain S-box-containing protein
VSKSTVVRAATAPHLVHSARFHAPDGGRQARLSLKAMAGARPRPRPTPHDFGIGELLFRVQDAVIVGNATAGRIVLWNRAAERLFGYSEDEAVGMALDRLVPESLRDRHRKGIAAYAKTGRGNLVKRGEPVELPALRKDRSEIWVELTLTSLRVRPDTDRFVVALARDVTERKDAERRLEAYATELNAANKELRSSQQALEEFTAALAHDLRAPITMITGSVDTLLGLPEDAPATASQQLLSILQRQTSRLAAMVEELLEVARLERGAADAQPEVTSVREALAAVVEAAAAENEVTVRCSARLRAHADPGHLRRIVQNYLANALAHGAPPVAIDARRRGRWVEVRVCDHGPGVAAEFAPRLFQRFSRASGGGGGLGLGLYAVRGLAVANGGDAGYAQNEPSGACFWVRLPAATADAVEQERGAP